MTASSAAMRSGVAPDAPSLAPGMLLSLMRYKQWADADLLRAALALPVPAPAPEGGYITAIIRHFHTVDRIFEAHLRGIPHEYTSSNPSEPASLSELQQCVSAVDEWYVEY